MYRDEESQETHFAAWGWCIGGEYKGPEMDRYIIVNFCGWTGQCYPLRLGKQPAGGLVLEKKIPASKF
jgi:hypothetical protein